MVSGEQHQVDQVFPEGKKSVIYNMYMTSGEVAKRIGVSKQTLLRAVKRGEILPVRRTPGGYLRFHPADVERYLAYLCGEVAERPSAAS